MNRIEEKTHPYADEIPQMEIRDTEAVAPGQQKSDSITTHNDSQGSHQCRRDEMLRIFRQSKNKNPLQNILPHLSLSLPGESNSRSRTIVAALP